MKVLLKRHRFLEEEILGTLILIDSNGNVVFTCKTLELAYRDNQKNISAVPTGTYPIVFEYSPRFQMRLWELKNVPGRSEAKIHAANFYRQLNGCIAVGDMYTHIDDDEYPDIRNSKTTLYKFHNALAEYRDQNLEIEII